MKKKAFNSFIFMIIILTTFFVSARFVNAVDDLQIRLNGYGIQNISYAGNEYITAPIDSSSQIINGILFTYPNGTQISYGWYFANASTDPIGVVNANRSNGSYYYQHIYRQGLNNSFTIRMNFEIIENKTVKIITNITNNDLSNNLTKITIGYFLPFATPSNLTLCTGCNTDDNVHISGSSANGFVAAKLTGRNYSVTFYSDNYSTIWHLNSATNYNISNDRRQYIFFMSNYVTPGGSESNLREDVIKPNQTKGYTFYMRFGDENTTITQAASLGFSTFRDEFPFLVNWSNRSPIARIFMSASEASNVSNPRGYFNDAHFNISNQTYFNISVLNMINNTINLMNNMTPRPQGVIVWNLEGEEFNHYFSYVGYPNKLANLSPEMNVVADEVFQMFEDAGYMLGLTLRPSDFQIGILSQIPTNCTSSTINWALANSHFITLGVDNNSLFNDLISNGYIDSNGTLQSSFGLLSNSSDFILGAPFVSQRQNIYNILQQEDRNHDLDDVYIATDVDYPYRGYVCRAPNTWSNRWPNDNLHNGTTIPQGRFPYYQHSPQEDTIILNNLRSKVNYSYTRWGVKLFYIDSTVYSDNGGGLPFNFDIIRQLQEEFPDVLFMPENEGYYWYGGSAAYNQANAGTYFAPNLARYIYPEAFTAIANYDGVNFSNSTINHILVESVKDGNIFMVDPQSSDPATDKILQIYSLAELSPRVNITSPTSTTYTSNQININLVLEQYATCWYSIDSGNTNITLGTTDRITFTNTTSGLTNGDYHIEAYCNDSAGLTNFTESVDFTVSVSSPPSSSGGSGGGGGGLAGQKSQNNTDNNNNTEEKSNEIENNPESDEDNSESVDSISSIQEKPNKKGFIEDNAYLVAIFVLLMVAASFIISARVIKMLKPKEEIISRKLSYL